jgi:hypothetical protein
MKYPELVIRRALSADPALGRLIGFRIFPMIVPTSAPMPFATYQRNSVNRMQAINSPPGVPTVDMSLNFFAAKYSEAREIADASRKLLDHLRTSSQGVSVSNVTIEDESEDMVQLEGGDIPPAWQITMTLSVQWSEI